MAAATSQVSDALSLLELAWGGQEGFVCLSIRDPDLEKGDDGYWRDKLFRWPEAREQVEHLVESARRARQDVYFAPAVFDDRRRDSGRVHNLHTLWADLDEVRPQDIPKDLAPTAIWETSPGRFQAIWKLAQPLDKDSHRTVNQHLSYTLGADKGGWDLTQVLRIPGLRNHKYDDQPRVELLSLNGHKLGAKEVIELAAAKEDASRESDSGRNIPDPSSIPKSAIRPKARALLRARPGRGDDRSARLWELECLLAEGGCTAEQIVALVRTSGWNKFRGRRGEIDQLFAEARKAVASSGGAPKEKAVTAKPKKRRRDEEETEVVDSEERPSPVPWGVFDSDHQPIIWQVADIWGKGEVGFISGLPKSFKSWISLDLAVSIATGTAFLGSFASRQANVLLVQEEDPRRVLQDRLVQVAASKDLVWANFTGPDTVQMRYELPDSLYIASNSGFQITDEEWLEWLEEQITKIDAGMVILDPLMMMAEGVDEFKAFEMMSQVLKPLKMIRQATGAGLVLVHHHTKQEASTGGGKMYGSVAFWAWEEAALHLNVTGPAQIGIERFSKHERLSPLTVNIPDPNESGWSPQVSYGMSKMSVVDILSQYEGGATLDELVAVTKMGRDALQREMNKLLEREVVEREKETTTGKGRKKYRYRLAKGVGVGQEEGV